MRGEFCLEDSLLFFHEEKNFKETTEYIVQNFGNDNWLSSIRSTNKFDLIISGFSIHHIENEKKKRLYNDIYKLLKPNGIFCVGDGRRDIGFGAKLIFNLAKLKISKEISYYWKTSINAGYTPEEISEILDKTDLKNKYKVIPDLFDILIINKPQ